jgi:hypothetical protein
MALKGRIFSGFARLQGAPQSLLSAARKTAFCVEPSVLLTSSAGFTVL